MKSDSSKSAAEPDSARTRTVCKSLISYFIYRKSPNLPIGRDRAMRPRAQLFIVVTAMLGAGLLISSFHSWHAVDYWRFSAYLVFAILASGLTVVLPGLNTSQSGNFLFTLLAILELSLPETMIMACVPTLVQCFWKMNRPARPIRLLFNVVCMMAPATWLSWWTYQLSGRL